MAIVHRSAAMGLALLALSLALAPDAEAKPRTMRWEDGLCTYSMRYDDQTIDAAALAETVELLKSDAPSHPIAPFAATPRDQAKIDADAFERDCAITVAKLRGLRMLDLPGLDDYRRERAHLAEDACRFGSTNIRGARNPAIYRTYEPAAAHCSSYVDALEGRSDLAAAWRSLVDTHCAKNVDPRSCRARFQARADAEPGDAGMRHAISDFGWNNCAVRRTLFNGDRNERNAEAGRKLFEAFRRQFSVRESCEVD